MVAHPKPYSNYVIPRVKVCGELGVPSESRQEIATGRPVASHQSFASAFLPTVTISCRRCTLQLTVMAFVANLGRGQFSLVNMAISDKYYDKRVDMFTLAHSVQQHREPVSPQVLHSNMS